MASISLEHVSRKFPGTPPGAMAVRDLCLHAASGELLVLVGPSGCGKTTTLRLIAGLDRPSEGSVRIGGRDVTRLGPRDRSVGMVFQDSALYEHLSVRRNLEFAMRMREVPRREFAGRIGSVSELLGIGVLLDRRPGTLSGGQRQRAALARALVAGEQCLLLDEPLSDLDAGLRAELRAELVALQAARGVTTIHVTHDQQEAMAMGQRIAVMSRGALQQIGTPEEIFHQPVNRFVAAFFGEPSMNFVPGRLSSEADQWWLLTEGCGRLALPAACVARLAAHAGHELVLGVRPADLRPVPVGERSIDVLSLDVEVDRVEWLGDQLRLRGTGAGGAPIVVSSRPGEPHARAGPAHFVADPARIHLFDPGEAGRRLA